MPEEAVEVKPLALSQKLQVILAVVKAFLTGGLAVLVYPLTPSSIKQPTPGREFHRRVFLSLGPSLSIAQHQWLNPSGTEAYHTWMKSRATAESIPKEPFTEAVASGGKLHWVGNQTAKKVILFFHSGGMAMPLHNGHISLINYFRKEASRTNGVDVRIAFLEYTLVPYAVYPTQFKQAVSALQMIISSGVSPSDIVVAGDSSGGQLALQIIGHILHPHPDIPPLKLTSPLAGIFLLSPWISFSSALPSWTDNLLKDYAEPKSHQMIVDAFRQSPLLDPNNGFTEAGGWWIEPTSAPSEWWSGADQITRHIMFVWGEREVMKSSIEECARRFQEGVKGSDIEVKLVEDPKGIHVGPVLDANFARRPGLTALTMAAWVCERLGK